ncbi:MAG: hypothetical protein UR60_C0002G0016 [Candidatus Moranbacteria bacterium GW2011_GWF2_34_56]|nr:MAG: hypothetical protein UR51_C0009G0065 [Candidatus Moranbacteria bacterium GW2011_GWF1_34_10]KKP65364.1 MAG: hypothetical protein UR60_C0002G0016 [Candidatus Moranbacteria bacterium GW2011_GWF2_34_56]
MEKISFNQLENLEERESTHNVYGKEKFSAEDAKKHVETIINDFGDHFGSLGYREEEPVLISSGVDSTVRFVGSPISVLKPYFIEGKIPNPGIFMHQDCIRTKNINKLLDDDFNPAWGSYFPNMGAITGPERIHEGCMEAFDFFEKKLSVSKKNILIRVSSTDQDLLGICRKRFEENNLEIDKKSLSYYRHKLGIDGVWGRNCNIALRNFDGNGFSDVGNLIIIENESSQLCLEISIGPSTSLKQMHGLDHVQDCTPVVGLELIDKKYRRKLEDAIVTSTVLFREGLRPFGQNARNRILKKYIKAISYFRIKCDLTTDELPIVISNFEKREFGEVDELVSPVMVEFIKFFEKDLLNKGSDV